MREMFSHCVVNQVKADAKTYLLSGDHGYALFDSLRKEKPDHFINAGVAEQNMVGVAAGLAKLGFYPIIYGLSAFVPVRVLEQIKIDFCYEELPGLFIGDGAGLVYSHLGTSHQSTEDISSLRAVPHIQIYSPSDKFELEYCFNMAMQTKKTVYLRMGKADVGTVHQKTLQTADFAWNMGPLSVVKHSQAKTAYFATGSMVKTAQMLAEAKGYKVDIYSVPFIKPFDNSKYAELLGRYEHVVSFEEHSIYGGLGDCLAAVIANLPKTSLKKIGIEDKFSNKCGTYDYLMVEHGLDLNTLIERL